MLLGEARGKELMETVVTILKCLVKIEPKCVNGPEKMTRGSVSLRKRFSYKLKTRKVRDRETA